MVKAKDKIDAEIGRGDKVSIIDLVRDIIEYAQSVGASDIHIDPAEGYIRVRLRVDGMLQDVFRLPKNIHSEVICRIKILSGLRTDEHFAAQDGRFRINLDTNLLVDIRVSIVPTHHGENAVLRLLMDKEENFTLESLGFSPANQEKILKAIKKPFGMILLTGPTGSGKTTTLYTILKMLNKPEVSIITIEDPVEYAVEGIRQIQVNPRTGLTFASGLRSILRQDPNIIMVGEIRDQETAGIAVNVALTGHLLLSTLHTNDPATTLPRLLDMKIESYLVASTVSIVIGQRLVRKICNACETSKKITEVEAQSIKQFLAQPLRHNQQLYFGTGCEQCGNTGFKGRIALQEVLEVSDEIKDAILRKATSSEINSIAVKNAMMTMVQDGLNKVFDGITTVEEVLRVNYE